MNYVFAAYSVVFVIIFLYTALQHRRVISLSHEVKHLTELESDLRKKLGQ